MCLPEHTHKHMWVLFSGGGPASWGKLRLQEKRHRGKNSTVEKSGSRDFTSAYLSDTTQFKANRIQQHYIPNALMEKQHTGASLPLYPPTHGPHLGCHIATNHHHPADVHLAGAYVLSNSFHSTDKINITSCLHCLPIIRMGGLKF